MKGLIGRLIQRVLACKPPAKSLAACGMELAACDMDSISHAFTLKARGMTPTAHCFCLNAHHMTLKACCVAVAQCDMKPKADIFVTK